MNIPIVSIIILNWNGWKDTVECLESLYQITYPNYDVILVDNGSKDESIEKIREYCEGKIEVESKFFEYDLNNKPIKYIEYEREQARAGGGKEKEIGDLPSNKKLIIIKNEKNYGFAKGNNIGMKYALKALNPDYVLLLNNDTVVDKEFLGELVKVAESDDRIGIVGPKIYYYDNPNKIWFAGGAINWWKGCISHIGKDKEDNGQYSDLYAVDQITGCAMLMKSDVIAHIGILDTIYYMNFEDSDFCIRANHRGYKILFVSLAYLWHKCGASKIKIGDNLLYHSTKSNLIFFRKWRKLCIPYLLLRYLFVQLYYLFNKDFDKAKAINKAAKDFLKKT